MSYTVVDSVDLTSVGTAVVAVLATAIGALVAQGFFRASRRLYSVELGEVKANFESARKESEATPSQVEREIDQLISELTSPSEQQPTVDIDDLRQHVGDVVRTEFSKLRQAEEHRAELILSEQYHRQGLAQSNLAFQLSLVFAGLGFLIIAASVVVVLASDNVDSGIVALISGTVVEAVSGLFFVQANQARNLMIQFFDRLRVDRSLEEALKLSSEVPDPIISSRLSTLLSVRLAQAEATDDVLRAVMHTDHSETAARSSLPDDPDGDSP